MNILAKVEERERENVGHVVPCATTKHATNDAKKWTKQRKVLEQKD